MKNEIDVYGIKNVNFTIIDEEDDRWDEFKKQRIERGFDDSELWNLDYTIAKFIYPRLKAFSENIIGYPPTMTCEDWEDILKTMVKAFEYIIEGEIDISKEKQDVVSKGLNYFKEYFFYLWN